MNLRIVLFFIASLFFINCNKSQQSGALVAQVGDKTLTWEELESVIPNNTSSEDSISLAESYIKDWVREQVVVVQAESNLTEEQKNFDELIESYRRT
jgi:hypothetical protein